MHAFAEHFPFVYFISEAATTNCLTFKQTMVTMAVAFDLLQFNEREEIKIRIPQNPT